MCVCVQDMNLRRCGGHGIKLSTFIHDVVIEGVAIVNATLAGVEVRGAWDLAIRANTITNPGETGIRLAGGARNVVVEKNLIRCGGREGGQRVVVPTAGQQHTCVW